MSSESEKDKERLIQAAKTFFFYMQDLASFTNALTKLFNSSMSTQILLMTVKEDGNVKAVFEQMLKISPRFEPMWYYPLVTSAASERVQIAGALL